jgi:hypothetical protein
VRQRLSACLVVMLLAFAVVASARSGGDDAAKYFGTYTGTWDGAGTGGFELTLEKNAAGAPGGKVSVTGEPTYKATLKKLSFDGGKMTAAYDFPPDDRLEIILSATFDGGAAKGTWTARAKENGSDMMSGGWNVKKQ